MQRFVNPHLQYQQQGGMQQYQQQGIRQNLPQQGMMQQGMMQPQMLPNGMMMLPNGMVVNPAALGMNPNMVQQPMMQPGMMQPGMMQQPMMQPGMMQPGMMQQSMMQQGMMQQGVTPYPNTSRFSNNDASVTAGISASPADNSLGNRYSNNASEETTMQEEETPKTFTITARKEIKFEGNDKVALKSYYEEVKPSDVDYKESEKTIASCVEEAIEYIAEKAYDVSDEKAESGRKLLTMESFIVYNTFYKCSDVNAFVERILALDCKSLYKELKNVFKSATNKYAINAINGYDSILTEFINDFLAVNSQNKPSIDSFMTDFNDLLKYIRNNEDELEDALIEYLDSFICSIQDNITIVEQTVSKEERNVEVLNIPVTCHVCYVDKLSYELGINDAPSKYVEVENSLLNRFLISLMNICYESYNTPEIYLVTVDKFVIKLTRSLSGKTFVKRV